MKKNFFLFLLLILFACSSSKNTPKKKPYHLVFIHLGKKIPNYTKDAIHQASLFNKNCNIILVGDKKALKKKKFSLAEYNVLEIPTESLKKTQSHKNFLKKSLLDRSFRNGFWVFTTERFFYLHELMNKFRLKNVFHLENDILLYVNLENLLPVFTKNYKNIAATYDDDDRCIPGFMYVSNPHSLKNLTSFIAQNISKNSNDMTLLALYKNRFDSYFIDNLPIVSKEYAKKYPLKPLYDNRTRNKENYIKNIDLFQSLFDAAAFGQYIGGIDPRNGDSSPGFINEKCVFNPSNFEIKWEEDEENRKIPFAVLENHKIRLNNLHIHSKNLKKFLSK